MEIVAVPDTQSDVSMVELPSPKVEGTAERKPLRALEEPAAEQPCVRPEWPNIMERLRSIYGDKVNEVSGAEIVRWDRDRF
jgi:hypothetical protein